MGHRLKFFYATQVRQAPPTFLLFVNRDELFSDQYKKHLAGQMRTAFGYEGCPIVLVPKAAPQNHRAGAKIQAGAQYKQREGLRPSGRRGTKDMPARAEENRAEACSHAANKWSTSVNASARNPIDFPFGNNVL